jgi:hypothetical protein
MDTLSALFGSPTKVKLIRLFLFHPGTPFFLRELSRRVLSSPAATRRELASLAKAGLIKKRLAMSKEITSLESGKTVTRKLKGSAYILDEKFPFMNELKTLITASSMPADESLAKRFVHAGRMRLIVAAGLFTQQWDSRIDLLIVADSIDQAKIDQAIRSIEAEVGKEISYSAFETQDFEYRFGIHDRLVRDVLDYPHITLLDRMGIEPQ